MSFNSLEALSNFYILSTSNVSKQEVKLSGGEWLETEYSIMFMS